MSAALWSLEEAAAAMGAAPRGTSAAPIRGVSIDTRKLAPGDLFFAVKGEHRDGHDFVNQAMERGATAVVSIARSFAMPSTHRLLVVEDPFEALRRLGRAARARRRGSSRSQARSARPARRRRCARYSARRKRRTRPSPPTTTIGACRSPWRAFRKTPPSP
jgi:UDP-N-acetylmuramoyl-tripeptide--D-alanyl-D-alanine ligase